MPELQHNRTLRLSVGDSRNAKYWTILETDVSGFIERLSISIASHETHAEFMALPADEQTARKDVGGFCGGEIAGNGQRTKANIIGRDILTLDFDDVSLDNREKIQKRIHDLNNFVICHSTRKHTEIKPRLRIIFILNRTVTPDEYEPLARKIAERLDIRACDPASFQVNQLMFFPSHCSDVEPVFWYRDRPLLDADYYLNQYKDWRDATQWPRAQKEQVTIRQTVQRKVKQQDPILKNGIIGTFCRIYDIPEAIEKFLQKTYEPFNNSDRYTYMGGSTVGGAVLYENRKFLYSFHATDPASRRLCNAFDLVRLHKFGELDVDADPKTPDAKLPSTLAMMKFARSLPEVQALHVQEKGTLILEQTNDLPENANESERKSYQNFFGKMENEIVTINVVRETLDLLKINMRINIISGKVELTGYPYQWSFENAVENLPTFLLDRFHLANMKHVNKDLIIGHLAIISDERRYNPVLEMFKTRAWDGQDRMLIICATLGVSDTLDMILIKKWLIQTAALPDNDPNNPFGADGVLTLQGLQGIGKTSFFRLIVPRALSYLFAEGREIDTRKKDSIMQATSAWICELGELERTTKKDEAALRPFITAIQDEYRAPYARTAKTRPRRTSFCASVNPQKFLTDEEGNRRFWTVPVKNLDLLKLRSLDEDFKQQLWAQSYEAFCADREQSFRLTKKERDDLNARNAGYTKALDYELEVFELCEFDLPHDQWRWTKTGDFAELIELKTQRYPPLNRLGRALTKISNNDKRIETKIQHGTTYYLFPIKTANRALPGNAPNVIQKS